MQKSDNPYLAENAQIAPLPSAEEEEAQASMQQPPPPQQKATVTFSIETMSQFSHEELQQVIRKYDSEYKRLKKLSLGTT